MYGIPLYSNLIPHVYLMNLKQKTSKYSNIEDNMHIVRFVRLVRLVRSRALCADDDKVGEVVRDMERERWVTILTKLTTRNVRYTSVF